MKNDDTHSREPAGADPVEARIVAWVLGEASEFEAAELERLCAEDPELEAFRQRTRALHGLLVAGESTADDAAWKLPAEKRAAVEGVIARDANSGNEIVLIERRVRGTAKRAIVGIAACLTVSVVVWRIIDSSRIRDTVPASPEKSVAFLPSASGGSREENVGRLREEGGDQADRGRFAGADPLVGSELAELAKDSPGEKPAGAPVDELRRGLLVETEKAWELSVPEGQAAGAGGALAGLQSADEALSRGDMEAKPKRPLRAHLEGDRSQGFNDEFDGKADAFAPEEMKAAKDAFVSRGRLPVEGQAMTGKLEKSAEAKFDDASQLAEVDREEARRPASRRAPMELGLPAPESPPPSASRFRYFVQDEGTKAGGNESGMTIIREFVPGQSEMADAGEIQPAEKMKSSKSQTDAGPEAPADPFASPAPAAAASPSPANQPAGLDALRKTSEGPMSEFAIEDREQKLEMPAKPSTATRLPERFVESPELEAREEPFSTFSLSVSDVSFQLAKAALERGERPDPSTIKVEQFYNAVDYGDPAPAAGEPVAATIEQAAHPVLPGRNLVRIGVRTGSTGRGAQQPLRLTLLIDRSGSMVREDRRAAMVKAAADLAELLTAEDRVSVIGFSRRATLLAENLPGNETGKLMETLDPESSEGGTNLEQALALADDLSNRHRLVGAQNRIVLFTDGAANLGDADPARLAEQVKRLRNNGIALDIAGIGAEDLNDRLLAELARNGNGRYYVAADNLAAQLAGAFRPAAEDAKVQVKFNPERVGAYKLIGFEENRLKTEDFRDDAVDAAELAAEEAAVALYQVEVLPGGSGEIGEVSVRFREAESGVTVERSWTIPHDERVPAFDRATPSMQLAGLSLLAAEKLRGGGMAAATDFRKLSAATGNVTMKFHGNAKAMEMLRLIGLLRE